MYSPRDARSRHVLPQGKDEQHSLCLDSTFPEEYQQNYVRETQSCENVPSENHVRENYARDHFLAVHVEIRQSASLSVLCGSFHFLRGPDIDNRSKPLHLEPRRRRDKPG